MKQGAKLPTLSKKQLELNRLQKLANPPTRKVIKTISLQGIQQQQLQSSVENNNSKFDERMFQDSNINQHDFDEQFPVAASGIMEADHTNFAYDDLATTNLFNASSPLSEAMIMVNQQNEINIVSHLPGALSNNNNIQDTQRSSSLNQFNNNAENELYDLCFVVENCEFLSLKQGFVAHSQYLRELLQNISQSQSGNSTPQVRILLPLWATARAFKTIMDYVNAPAHHPMTQISIGEDDLVNVQRILWLADFFQILPLQDICIAKNILPRLSHDNVVTFLDDAYSKVAQCQQSLEEIRINQLHQNNVDNQQMEYLHQMEDMWYDFFSRCLDAASTNFENLIKTKEKDLLQLPEPIIDEIIERAFNKVHRNQQARHAIDLIVKFMLKIRGLPNVFDLLNLEKQKARDQFSFGKPILTWRLGSLNLKQNFYRESDLFRAHGLQWKLFITKTNDKECMIGVKCLSCPTPNAARIMSLIGWVKIGSTNEKAPQIETHLDLTFSHSTTQEQATSDKAPSIQLRTIPLLLFHQVNSVTPLASATNSQLNVEVYFQLNHTVSTLLTHISDKFSQFSSPNPIEATDPLQQLESQELSLLLQDKYLSVKSEDEVIDALATWCHRNIESTEDKVMVEDIMRNVNWPYVSLEKILDLYKQFPRLRHNIHTKGIFHNQLKFRSFKRDPLNPNNLAPMPRPLYDQLSIDQMFDYHYFLDKLADYIFKMFDKDQLQTGSSRQDQGTPNSKRDAQIDQLQQILTYPSDNQLSSQRKKTRGKTNHIFEGSQTPSEKDNQPQLFQSQRPSYADQFLRLGTPAKVKKSFIGSTNYAFNRRRNSKVNGNAHQMTNLGGSQRVQQQNLRQQTPKSKKGSKTRHQLKALPDFKYQPQIYNSTQQQNYGTNGVNHSHTSTLKQTYDAKDGPSRDGHQNNSLDINLFGHPPTANFPSETPNHMGGALQEQSIILPQEPTPRSSISKRHGKHYHHLFDDSQHSREEEERQRPPYQMDSSDAEEKDSSDEDGGGNSQGISQGLLMKYTGEQYRMNGVVEDDGGSPEYQQMSRQIAAVNQELTSRQPEKLKLTQRRLSGMKFMNDLNHASSGLMK